MDDKDRMEKDTHQIRVDVATLSERSKSFATKEDVQLIRTDVQKELTNQTRWLATTMIAIASVGLAVAKYLFG